MKVTPVSSPSEITQAAPVDSRARAIEAFNRTAQSSPANQVQAQEHPVADANNISPEEVSAIRSQVQTEETLDNSDINEDTQEVEPQQEAPQEDLAARRQFAELARQERILRAKAQKQAQEMQSRDEALRVREAALEEKARLYEQGYISKDRLKSDPLSVLAEADLSYDTLTEQLLSQQPRDPRIDAEISSLKAELRALRTANEEGQKASKTQQEEAYKAAVRQIEMDTTSLVKNDPETYEAIAKTKSIRDVVELIEETYKKDGILLSVEEAAQEVEDYLVEEGYNTVTRIDKIKRRLAQNSASTAPTDRVKQQTQVEPQQTQMKTLTNATASTRKLTARERAMLAFKGELKP
jgi:hypothetical protein